MKLFIAFLIGLIVISNVLHAQDSLRANYWLGKSTGKLPSLAYGLGDDRLGGAKMGYIDTNVVFKIIDSVQNMYVVQLSKFHTAFIDKSYIKKDSSIHENLFYLTNSVNASATDSSSDMVSISLSEKLPYKSWMEINPSKIIIEIYGVQSNTNWITQLSSLREVKNIYYNQIEDDVVQFVIELKHTQHWGYHIFYDNNKLELKIKHQPQKIELSKLKIAIDAGHGGTNVGAEGIKTKIEEKEYTLKFAKALQQLLLKKGVSKVIMTRTTDTSFDMKDRILMLQQANPDIVISLHLNSSGNTQIKGTSTYYKHIGFRPVSQTILNRMLEIKLDEFGNVGSFNFGLNAPTDFINVLLEIAFLSNEQDEKRISDTKFQKLVAIQIYKGLTDWVQQLQSKK